MNWVGHSVDVLSHTKPTQIEKTDDNKLIYHYKKNACQTAYIVDAVSKLIIDWRYESSPDHCYVGIGWGDPW